MEFQTVPEAFESKIRIAVMACLIDGEKDWGSLKEITGASDGNLSTHLAKLENSGYIHINKTFLKKRPHTTYCLTSKAICEFREYVDMLEQLINKKTDS